jgi:hypothetical protein
MLTVIVTPELDVKVARWPLIATSTNGLDCSR